MHVFFAPVGSLSFHKTTSCSDYNGGRLIWVQHKVAGKKKKPQHSYAHYNDMGDVNLSLLLNTTRLVGGITRKPRYYKRQNKGEL